MRRTTNDYLRQTYYIKRRKKNIKFIVFYLTIVIIFVVLNTFSRYVKNTEGIETVEIANWNVTVNGQSIKDVQQVTIELISDETKSSENKFAPNESGSFEITINPNGTEVAIEYEINFETTILPEGLTFNTYTINNEENQTEIQNNKITGEIGLTNRQTLNESDIVVITVYWNWDESENDKDTLENTENQNYNMSATVTAKQKIQ